MFNSFRGESLLEIFSACHASETRYSRPAMGAALQGVVGNLRSKAFDPKELPMLRALVELHAVSKPDDGGGRLILLAAEVSAFTGKSTKELGIKL